METSQHVISNENLKSKISSIWIPHLEEDKRKYDILELVPKLFSLKHKDVLYQAVFMTTSGQNWNP